MTTSKEISERLKKVGFEGEHTETWQAPAIYNKEVSIEEVIRQEYEVMVLRKNGHFPHHEIPAYDAEVLFEWLAENNYDISFYFGHYHEVRWDIGKFSDSERPQEKTLADTLAVVILEILENSNDK